MIQILNIESIKNKSTVPKKFEEKPDEECEVLRLRYTKYEVGCFSVGQ